MPNIPYSRQSLDSSDFDAVRQTLASDWITQGPKIDEFERAIADYCGAKFAVAVSSGTAALHLAALAAGLKKGDEAITSPITFLSTANCILYVGATPVFADIDYDTVNINPAGILKLISKKTKAILPVDFAGLPAVMPEIRRIADRRSLIVIEDASHALGAESAGHKVGSCRYADMTVFSFHPVKHITTGEGGCITTNDKGLYQKLKSLRTHGVEKTKAVQKKYGGWYYEMTALGFNYRITDIQCALGISQLAKLSGFIDRRVQIARLYDQLFLNCSAFLKLPAQKVKNEKHIYHLYLMRLKGKFANRRRTLYEHLKSLGIGTQVHYIPVYRQPYYREQLRGKKIHCPNAERYYKEVLSLPIFPGLDDGEVKKIANHVTDFLKKSPDKTPRRTVLAGIGPL